MYRTIQSKTILSKYKQADNWFGTSFSMNLYRGCEHQCIYCDSRSECYQLGDLRDIRIKENALQILEKELKSKRQKGTIGFGSMNDPYMPVEKQEELVRDALKLLVRYRFPAHIITKSDLVLRDVDLLKRLSELYCAVSFTITTASDKLAKIIEPAAPVSSRRIEAMRQLSEAGIYTGVTLMPLLPFINDRWEEVEELLLKIKENGAKYVLFFPGLTLRAGSREYYYEKLDRYFPGIKEQYIETFGDSYTCNSIGWKELTRKAKELCESMGLPMKMEFWHKEENSQMVLGFE